MAGKARGPVTKGSGSAGSENKMAPARMDGPTPIRFATRLEVAAPTMPPSDATVNRRPRLNGVKPRAFLRYKISRAAKIMLEKKFDHAVHAAIHRNRGSPKTTWRPSRMSARTDWRSTGGGTGSLFRMTISVRAEKKNEAASNTMATAAPNPSMTAPATAGPPVPAVEFEVSSMLFSNGPAPRTYTAITGRASPVNWSPSREMD